MKIPTPDGFLIDVTAPVLPAFEVGHRWIVWCDECKDWHEHGAGEGHREAHCNRPTRYSRTGYNLSLAGKMTKKEFELRCSRAHAMPAKPDKQKEVSRRHAIHYLSFVRFNIQRAISDGTRMPQVLLSLSSLSRQAARAAK